MVFEKIMDIFKNNSKNKEKSVSLNPINSLYHGKKHLHNKKKKINKLQILKSFKENFSNNKELDEAVQRELNILANLENNYNKTLSEYSQKYKIFMENYNSTMINLRDCKTTCFTKYPKNNNSSNERLRESCMVGCKLKGPVVVPKQNTYSGHKISREGCDSLTYLKCDDGKVLGEEDVFIDSDANKDSNGVSLRDGCSACGGGIGGKPKANISGHKITNCDNVYSPWGFKKSNVESAALINACNSGKNLFKNATKAGNLYLSFNEITGLNKQLMNQAVNIFNKIKEIRNIDKGISDILKNEARHLQNQMQLFNDRQFELLNIDASKTQGNVTITAQMEDMFLKENSEQMKVFFWSSLAIISILFTINQMKK